MTEYEWKPGDRCRVVEHNPVTGEPKQGGRVLPATVTGVNGPYVAVKAESEGSVQVLGPLYFWADSGWHARDGEFRWRLLPGTAEDAAATAGEENGNG